MIDRSGELDALLTWHLTNMDEASLICYLEIQYSTFDPFLLLVPEGASRGPPQAMPTAVAGGSGPRMAAISSRVALGVLVENRASSRSPSDSVP
jgi:hypothetical protein